MCRFTLYNAFETDWVVDGSKGFGITATDDFDFCQLPTCFFLFYWGIMGKRFTLMFTHLELITDHHVLWFIYMYSCKTYTSTSSFVSLTYGHLVVPDRNLNLDMTLIPTHSSCFHFPFIYRNILKIIPLTFRGCFPFVCVTVRPHSDCTEVTCFICTLFYATLSPWIDWR